VAPIRRILLATDLEPHSDRAMDRAVQLVRQHDAVLTVLYAIRTGHERRAIDNLPPHHIEAEIRRHLEMVSGSDGIETTVVATKGPVGQAMARNVEIWKADLIVVGRAEPSGGLAGVSTVETVFIETRLPLLAVVNKPFGPYAEALVPVDFLGLSGPALSMALTMVDGGVIRVLHVFDALPPLAAAGAGPAIDHSFDDDFARLTEMLPTDTRRIATKVRLGLPVEEIVAEAQTLPQPDLVIMGSTGRSGLGRALFGSVALDVLERMPCDVLIIPENPSSTTV
jgi:nucleotide-binding universal stress UspA family protein